MTASEAIRDPIHGYVAFEPAEMRLIDTAEVQRLRRISQLGLTELVYPGARHSRLEHAIGTVAVVTRLFEGLRGRLGLERWFGALGLAATDREFGRTLAIARAAALLHDIGHAPFSHVTEELLPAGEGHEDRTLRLAREGEVGVALGERGTEFRDAVLACLDPRREPSEPPLAFVRETISGSLGADRMDYLLRDSRATGVSYGIFDLERVLHTVVPIESDRAPGVRLGIDRGGVLAAEGMLWARTSMFQQVYLHRTRRILDLHLRAFLRELLPGGRYPAEPTEYRQWDDPRVAEELRRAAGEPSGPRRAAARRILAREHHRALPGRVEGGSPAEVRDRLEAWRQAALAADPAADPIADLVDEALDPLGGGGEILVLEPSGARTPLARASALVGRLAPAPYGRLYVAPGRREGLVAAGIDPAP